jgi:dihydroorotate dehydrogenase (fumarate)
MADLSTHYCGLQLTNPLIVAASPLTAELASVKQLAGAGAAAIVLPSLFEEAVQANGRCLTAYADKIKSYKDVLSIPVIASLNGVTEQGWLEHANTLQQAGCDAIELNVYYVAANVNESSDQVERRYIDLAYKLRAQMRVPVIMKLSHQFSAPAHLVKRLEETGVSGVVLFNRFYQPDIDLEQLTMSPALQLSTSAEALLRIRWIGMLRDQVGLSLAASGGIHTADDVLKALLVGADAVQLCSVLLKHGTAPLTELRQQLDQWLEAKGYASVQQIQGRMSYGRLPDPSGFERENYLQLLAQNP